MKHIEYPIQNYTFYLHKDKKISVLGIISMIAISVLNKLSKKHTKEVFLTRCFCLI